MNSWIRVACLAMGATLAFASTAETDKASAKVEAAKVREGTVVDIKPDRIYLMDVTHAGDRLVAVGERGFALISDDAGKTWRAVGTPARRTLTGVAFNGDQLGVAVGHGGTLVRTEDGGTIVDRGADGRGDGRVAARCRRAGRRQVRRLRRLRLLFRLDGRRPDLDATGDHRRELRGPHLAGRARQRRAVAGRRGRHAGALGRRRRDVRRGALAVHRDRSSACWWRADGSLLLYGMRGSIYRSADAGATWQKIEVHTTASFNGGRVLSDGRIMLVGNAGLVAHSADNGQVFEIEWSTAGKGFSAVAEVPGGVVTVGERGAAVLDPATLVRK